MPELYPPLSFEVVSSSSGEVYTIEMSRKGDNLTCTCTCAAGENGMHCKHRIGILTCDPAAVRAMGKEKAAAVAAMVSGTDVEAALHQMLALEREREAVEKQLKAAKKSLARSLSS